MQKLLSREQINNIQIEENGERLVLVKGTDRLKISDKFADVFLVREKVLEMLNEAADSLPIGFTLIFLEGFRSRQKQQQIWDSAILKVEKGNPNFSKEEIGRKVRLSVAAPTGKGGHQTGGAVDVALGDEKGNELFLGTEAWGFSEKTFTFNELISSEEQELRKVLFDAMIKAGFQNYPAEWWHYSYGDQLWAAYGGHPKAIYSHLDIE
ncbi:MAG: M15 family metallopeptidase [bacterium]